MLNKKTMLMASALAAVAINKHLLVAADVTAGSIKVATGPADIPMGVSTEVDEPAGATVDYTVIGFDRITYGGAIAFGDPLTSDANGKAVKATAGDYVYGYAQEVGAADDIGSILLQPGAKAT